MTENDHPNYSPRANKAQCNHCGVILESIRTHDFFWCDCEDGDMAFFVDGGQSYVRRGGGERASWTEIDEPFTGSTAALEHSNIVLSRVHSPSACRGRACTIHNRSDHRMRSWEQVFEYGRMYRLSPKNGKLYRDPDEPLG